MMRLHKKGMRIKIAFPTPGSITDSTTPFTHDVAAFCHINRELARRRLILRSRQIGRHALPVLSGGAIDGKERQ